MFVGLFQGKFCIEDVPFHTKESELVVSRTATVDDFQYVLTCIKKKVIQPEDLVSDRFRFGESDEAMKRIVDPASGIFKAVISMI